eukprot:2710855-Amphidinium_carterae.1
MVRMLWEAAIAKNPNDIARVHRAVVERGATAPSLFSSRLKSTAIPSKARYDNTANASFSACIHFLSWAS